MGYIDAEARAAAIRYLNTIPKFRVVTRVSVMSDFPGTRVSVGPDEGTAEYRWR